MTIEDFITNFADQFENTDQNIFHENTEFRSLEEWSSLHALLIIAMIYECYHINMTGSELRHSNTILDLFNIVHTKRGE